MIQHRQKVIEKMFNLFGFFVEFSAQMPNKKNGDERKTTITAISRRRSTLEQDLLDHTRSAPPSPALNYISKQRLSQAKISMDTIENVCLIFFFFF
jgi:hypothetical protein